MNFFVNKHDIKYQFWLSIPECPEHVVFWFHGSTTIPAAQLALERPIEFELATNLLPGNCILVTPVIPKVDNTINKKIIDPQCLCRNVMFDNLIDPSLFIYNRPDKEVLKIFAYLQKFVFPVLGVSFDQFDVGGFSAGGNFASLFSVLYPRYVRKVISLMSCAYCLPVDRIHDVCFDFPFGNGNLNRISDINHDIEAQKLIHYLIYHGEHDDNDPIEYFADNNMEEGQAIKSITGETPIERFRFAMQVYREKGFSVEGHLVPGIGHAIHDITEVQNILSTFLLKERSDNHKGIVI